MILINQSGFHKVRQCSELVFWLIWVAMINMNFGLTDKVELTSESVLLWIIQAMTHIRSGVTGRAMAVSVAQARLLTEKEMILIMQSTIQRKYFVPMLTTQKADSTITLTAKGAESAGGEILPMAIRGQEV